MKDSTWRVLFAIMAFVLAILVVYKVLTGKEDIDSVAIMMLLCYNTSLLFRPKN